MNIEMKKKNIIDVVNNLNNELELNKIEALLQEIKKQELAYNLASPLREKIDLEELKKEQNYTHKKPQSLKGNLFQDESYLQLLKLLTT